MPNKYIILVSSGTIFNFITWTFSCQWNIYYFLADNLCKQFRPRSGPTERRSWSGSKPFDTLKVFLFFYFEIQCSKFWRKKTADENKHMNNYLACNF